jgi:hypothetical protein
MRGELGRDWWSGRQRRRALRTAGRRLRGARCVCVRVWCGIGPSPHRQSGRQPAARCCPFGTTRNGRRSGSRYTRGLLPAPRRALWPRHIKSAAARCITPSAAPASSPRAPNSDSRWRRVPDACSTCCGRGGCRRMHDAAHRWRSARRPLDAFCRSSVLQAAGGCAASRRLVVWRTQARRCAHRWRACRAPPHAPPPRCRCGRMIAASDGAHHPPALARPPRRHSNISAPLRPRGVSSGAARAPLRQRRRGRCSVKEVFCRDADSNEQPRSARV